MGSLTSALNTAVQALQVNQAAVQLASVSGQIYSDATQAALDAFDWTNTTTDAAAVHD